MGLCAVEGGRHPGRGTANLVIPLGSQYVELLTVVDEDEAARSPQGRPVLEALARRGPGVARWGVQSDDIEAVARRLGFPVERRRRVRPDGVVVTWRSVAVDEAWAEPWRCAFMAFDDAATHPAHEAVTHANGATGVARLDVVVPDETALTTWLGGPVPDGVRLTTGDTPGPAALSLSTPDGPVPVDPPGEAVTGDRR